ncbi:response regulator [Nitriliruptor alkaliphilus]|uniref:response regulator n=1 Tax=Nitriliruptor alkaliphilus TaxID=427918 RepID=UPI000698A051|nr:response regulator transcription factor [Nitriliruptor alkaliphilus]
MAESPIKVLVIDDDEHVRAALREVLDAQRDIRWVGDAADAWSAVSACLEHRPDVVVIDVRLPGGGASATREVRAHCDGVVVVAHSDFGDRPHRELMLAAGAAGYVTKGAPRDQLLRAIRDAATIGRSEG